MDVGGSVRIAVLISTGNGSEHLVVPVGVRIRLAAAGLDARMYDLRNWVFRIEEAFT